MPGAMGDSGRTNSGEHPRFQPWQRLRALSAFAFTAGQSHRPRLLILKSHLALPRFSSQVSAGARSLKATPRIAAQVGCC